MSFESFLAAGRPDPKTARARRRALALALGVHAVMLAAAVVHAGWRVDEISPPTTPITLINLPAPPPPPAGPARTQRPPRVRRRPVTTALVQPQDPVDRTVKEEVDPPDIGPPGDDLPGDGNGARCPEGATCNGPPAPPDTFIAPNVATGRLAIDPQAEPYRVKLPPALSRTGMRLWLLAKLCVSPDGQVERVSLIRGADPTLDPLVIATLKTWRYRPYAVNGRPVPFCTNVRYEIATQ